MMKHDQSLIQKKLAGAVELDAVGIVSVGETVVEKLEAERKRILGALQSKELLAVGYEKLVESLTKLTHDIQLLSGKPTEITLEEQLKAEEDELNARINAAEARIGRLEGGGAKAGAKEAEVPEGQSGEGVRPKQQD